MPYTYATVVKPHWGCRISHTFFRNYSFTQLSIELIALYLWLLILYCCWIRPCQMMKSSEMKIHHIEKKRKVERAKTRLLRSLIYILCIYFASWSVFDSEFLFLERSDKTSETQSIYASGQGNIQCFPSVEFKTKLVTFFLGASSISGRGACIFQLGHILLSQLSLLLKVWALIRPLQKADLVLLLWTGFSVLGHCSVALANFSLSADVQARHWTLLKWDHILWEMYLKTHPTRNYFFLVTVGCELDRNMLKFFHSVKFLLSISQKRLNTIKV